jgi:hypothetical protein
MSDVRAPHDGYRPEPRIPASFVVERFTPTSADLAWATASHWLTDAEIEKLAKVVSSGGSETRSSLAVRDRWLSLAAAWLYRNRNRYPDPWAELEELWEAFDHAEVLSGLIRWMPAPVGEPQGLQAMFERWRSLAETQSASE